jgi:hypothetical protein
MGDVSENLRLEYEGVVELEKAEGVFGVVHLEEPQHSDLATELFKLAGVPEPEDFPGWYPDRKIRARIVVEILDPEYKTD